MMIVLKDNIIEALEWLSDYEFQKIAWFDNDQGLSYGYAENVEDIFDYDGLKEALEAGEIAFSKQADQALHDLRVAVTRLAITGNGMEKQKSF